MSYFSTTLVQSQKALCPTIAWTIIVKLSIEKKKTNHMPYNLVPHGQRQFKCLLPLNGYTELPSTYLLLSPGVTVLGHGGNLQVDAPSTSSASPLNEVDTM